MSLVKSRIAAIQSANTFICVYFMDFAIIFFLDDTEIKKNLRSLVLAKCELDFRCLFVNSLHTMPFQVSYTSTARIERKQDFCDLIHTYLLGNKESLDVVIM